MDFSIIFVNIIIIIISIGFLWKGSDWLVESSSKLAHAWGVSDLVIGLTVVAIGTSAPEFAVTISAVLTGKADISVSNVVGSNIFNLGFILGGTACFHAIATSPKLVYRDGFFLISVTLLLSFFLFDYHIHGNDMVLSRVEGIILISMLLIYLAYLFIKKEDLGEDISHDKIAGKDYLFLFMGIAGVVGGGHLLVEASTQVARQFGISDWVIGVTIVAAGTSTPELATSIMALVKNRHGMAIGNLIGSDLFNLLGVLGLAAILKQPLAVSPEAQGSMIMLVIMVVVVVIFMRTKWQISRLQGLFLLVVNVIRWVADFMGKGI